MFEVAVIVIALVGVGFGLFYFKKSQLLRIAYEKTIQKEKEDLDRLGTEAKESQEKREKEMGRRMYELAILKELGERIGYSLNVQNIVDVITSSLHQFIEYNAVSYMLIGPEKILFKVHLEKSVSRSFIDDVKNRMLTSLSALLGTEFSSRQVEELLSGAILIDEVQDPVRSFFNIPLIIGEKVVGVLTVADTVEGLYKEEEMTILYKITKQASQAVSRLQEVVETEQKKLSSMVESMTEGVIMTDNDYRLIVVNPTAKKIIGADEKKDLTIFDFIDNLGGAYDIRGRLEESVKLDKVIIAENVLIKDKYYQIFVSPVKSTGIKGEEVLGGVVIFHDITHEKELERLREDFISMMVHELRAPLGNVNKFLELLEGGTLKSKSTDYKEMINMVSSGTAGMLELINDMLDAAKLEAGKFEITKAQADIKKVVLDRLHFFALSAKSAKVKLLSEFDTALPEAVSADAGRIAQVLNNLLSNAIKFTNPGGSVSVQAILHHANGNLEKEAKEAGITWFISSESKEVSDMPECMLISVTDTGRGIPGKVISELFSKFRQVQSGSASTNGRERGTGLGLVIAKGIVEAHGGRIGVASREGSGSTFYFTLPL